MPLIYCFILYSWMFAFKYAIEVTLNNIALGFYDCCWGIWAVKTRINPPEKLSKIHRKIWPEIQDFWMISNISPWIYATRWTDIPHSKAFQVQKQEKNWKITFLNAKAYFIKQIEEISRSKMKLSIHFCIFLTQMKNEDLF